jgi:hypothetical protein
MRYEPGGAEIQVGVTTFVGRSHTEIARLIAFDHKWRIFGDQIIEPNGSVVADTLEEAACKCWRWAGSSRRGRPSIGTTSEAPRAPMPTPCAVCDAPSQALGRHLNALRPVGDSGSGSCDGWWLSGLDRGRRRSRTALTSTGHRSREFPSGKGKGHSAVADIQPKAQLRDVAAQRDTSARPRRSGLDVV